MRFSVKHDLNRALRELSNHPAVIKAANRALNRTGDQVQTRVVRDLAQQTGLKQKDIRAALIRVRAQWTRLLTSLTASGRTLNLIRFGARQTRAGVSANAWGQRRIYPHTFIANRGRTVFRRAVIGGKRVRRLPIVPVHGPSIPREMAREAIRQAVEQTVHEQWPKNFQHELEYYLSKARS